MSTLALVTISTGTTLEGNVGTSTFLTNTITNKGTLQIDGAGGNNAFLYTNGDVTLQGGGTVHGIITESLYQRGHSHAALSQQEILPTLRARKERMAALADAFIALPGGVGTIEEFMAVWAMNQLGEVDKPCGLLDTEGFYAPFLAFVDRMVEAKFLPAAHRHAIAVDTDASALIGKLQTFERVNAPKWL